MIAAHLRMRKIAREQRGWDNERARGREKASDEAERGRGECVTTLKKMPATRTKIKMITHPAADVRALRVTHAHTRTPTYRRRSNEGEKEGAGVCRDAGPLPRCFVI